MPVQLPAAAALVTRIVKKPNSYPCRRCLTDGVVGETMNLISYNPFPTSARGSPYEGPGPIFVHGRECDKYTGTDVPDQQRRRLLSLRAYDKEHMMIDGWVLQGTGLEEKAVDVLQNENVQYLHVHYAGPGCFAVKVERD